MSLRKMTSSAVSGEADSQQHCTQIDIRHGCKGNAFMAESSRRRDANTSQPVQPGLAIARKIVLMLLSNGGSTVIMF